MLRKLSILTIFIGLWGCTPSPKVEITAETSSKNLPLVVATTSVLCDLTKQVAQDTADLMTRGEFKEKLFDADAGWLGPKYLKGFYDETCWEKRVEMIKNARNGGSMTPVIMTRLRHLEKKGRLKLKKNCQVIDLQTC